MKPLAMMVLSLSLVPAGLAAPTQGGAATVSGAPQDASSDDARTMKITRSGSQAPEKGPAEYFTGSVRVVPLFAAHAPARTAGVRVTFEPGARSAWHTHPLGQTLIVTDGTGWIQQEGGERQVIKPGDVVWTPPGVRHWHGATATESLTHIAIQEALDGKNVEWMEKVSDDHYRGRK
jgi:quercetin dioxygenase-like cupin family protein